MAATARFYSVPGVNHTSSEGEVLDNILQARLSLALKSKCAGEQLAGLDGRHPEEFPSCFAALQAGAKAKLSPVTGWETEHGTWEPRKMHAAGPGFGDLTRPQSIPLISSFGWTRTTLVFRPKDGRDSDLAMTMYTRVNWIDGKAYLEEDMTFCRVYRLPKKIGSFAAEELAVSYWRSLFGHIQPLDASDYFNTEATGNGVGGPKKRPRSKTVGGTLEKEKPVGETGSCVWHHFTRIYTKDPQVVFAACHHCGRMMKLTGGSGCGTKSLSNHNKVCKFKPRNTLLETLAGFEIALLGQSEVLQKGLMPC